MGLTGTSVRKVSVRMAARMSFRAGPQGGLGSRGEREKGGWEIQWLALSGHLLEVEGGRESDSPDPGEGMNR